jgi:FtsP/CotA-like multicopper oxidase with cupredoxin domain
VRIAFEDFTGTAVYHCHILDHEDNGMMGVISVG